MKIELIEDVTCKEPLLTIRCATSDNVEVKQLHLYASSVNGLKAILIGVFLFLF